MAYITGKPKIDKVNQSLCDNYTMLKKGQIPKSYVALPLEMCLPWGSAVGYINWRDKYVKDIGFPLIAEDWVKPLAKWIGDRPCLEIMAGTGFLSYALFLYGVDIKATDNYSWNKHFTNFKEVENIDCLEAVKIYGKDVKFIICSWPYMDEMAYNSLVMMREINPKCRMIYIGEDWGGCTASDKFFEIAEECEVDGFNQAVSKYRRWSGLHDRVKLYK